MARAQMRQLKKRDLNREAQRRFRDRQKAALALLESTTQSQQREIEALRLTNKLLEEQYRVGVCAGNEGGVNYRLVDGWGGRGGQGVWWRGPGDARQAAGGLDEQCKVGAARGFRRCGRNCATRS